MKVEDFKKNEAFVSQMRSLQSSPLWDIVMKVLMAEHPCRLDNPNWNQEQRAAHQSRVAGYEKALNVLDALVEEWVPPKPVLTSKYQKPNDNLPKE